MLSWVKFICPAGGSLLCEMGPVLYSISLSASCGVVTELLLCAYLTMHGKFFFFRVSRWFRQARKPLLIACGGMAKSARCCSPRPSRRFAKRTIEQWTLYSQGTIAFHLHTLRVTVLLFFSFFFSSCSCLARAAVCLMFLVFLA